MPIDINLIRADKGGDPDVVRQSEIQRCRDGIIVDEVIAADNEWRKSIFEMESLKKQLNALNKNIGKRKKTNRSDTCQDLVDQANELKTVIPVVEEQAKTAENLRDRLLYKIGNLVDKTVLPGNDETNNSVIRTWGHVDKSFVINGTPGHMHHHEIMAKLGMINLKKGSELVGHRGYFLKGVGVLLNMALINYGLTFLRRRKYEPIQPPYMMRREVMAETAELADFNETLYKIPMGEGKENKNEKDDLYLIATSEQPISALHRGEFLEPKTLPIKYSGISTCFRKEAGSHGKDMWGIFRIHQFEKVEQFCITTPEESAKTHEEMIETSEDFYKSLGLPYRIVSIVAGALNDAASKKYDLEAWFPGYNDYRELVSCSNCLDYQSRALEIRLGHSKQGDREKKYVHMLNGTLVATQRAACCILENYQTPEGVKIPDVLVPYMDNIDFLHYPKKSETGDEEKATDI